MKQSQLFTKALKQAPKNEESVNARFLVRAGFVDKLMSGVYSYLPLGILVLKKIPPDGKPFTATIILPEE